MKDVRSLYIVCAMISLLSKEASAKRVDKSDFIKTILDKGRDKLVRVIQPTIARMALERLEAHEERTEHASDPESTSDVHNIADQRPQDVAPLRRVRKRMKMPKHVPRADFSQPWFSEWDENGQYVGKSGGKNRLSPIEMLIQLAHCLNSASSLVVSPSNRYIDLGDLSQANSWIDPEQNRRSSTNKPFDLQSDYRLVGDKIGVPDESETWNIVSNLSYNVQRNKNAVGMCVNLSKNQGFSVLTPRYTDKGRVKKASALARELEQACAKHPYTFLASIFVPT